MARRWHRYTGGSLLGLVAASAALLSTGCGPLVLASGISAVDAGTLPVDASPECVLARCVRPVADLSRAEIGLPKLFVGVAMARAMPDDRSLEANTVYDMNIAWDVPSALTLEVVLGLWELPDRPLAGADSALEMTPIMASVLLAKEMPRWQMRMYLGAGAGLSANDYSLGGGHRAAMLDDYGLTYYDAKVEDSLLTQMCGGLEFYSSWDAKLNLALELRYVSSDIDLTERLDAETRSQTAEVKIWLVRGNITWHF